MSNGVQMTLERTSKNGGVEALKKRVVSGGLKIGLLSGLGTHPESDELTIPEVGAVNEFGAPGVPERPFIRRTMGQNAAKYGAMKRKLLAMIINDKMNVDKAVAVLGMQAQTDVVAAIDQWSDPPNSSETQSRKGEKAGVEAIDNPLVDTGIMKKSIHWEQVD